MSVLEVKDVSIRYMTGDFKDIGLLEYLQRRMTGDYHTTEFWADQDVSFTLEKGDMLGIIGINGAGKTTLLKAVSGIMIPTKGQIRHTGSMASLLELGSGFDGNLTVRENVYLRGAILGYTRQFIDETYDQMIGFAGLQDFQDYPFRHLSSGMRSRLAFSIVSLVQPDILILDEVLSVGDGAFRKKSEDKMRSIIASGATTILVSHSISQIQEMCNKVLWLHQGRQVEFGTDVKGICQRYVQFLDGAGAVINNNQAGPRSGLVRQPPRPPAGQPPFTKGLVSVVTPVFNGEQHLSRMLDSILGQTYDRMEMILVDDGSTDRTLAVAESYREKFAARGYGYRIVPAPHTCASGAINHGLPFVTGEYLIWPDSDDVLEPQSVETRVAFLREHPAYHCVRSLSYYVDAKTGKTGTPDEKTGDLGRDDLFWDVLEIRTFVSCGCYMLKSEDFFSIYPQRKIPQYDVGQNFQMLLPFLYYYRCPTLQERLYGVYMRENSHSRRKLTQAQEEKKYLDYEHLVDDITEICHIRDKRSLVRLARWKLNRRQQLSWKYHHTIRWPNHLRLTWQAKGSISWKLLKTAAWYSLEDTWVVTWLYPRYRRVLSAVSSGKLLRAPESAPEKSPRPAAPESPPEKSPRPAAPERSSGQALRQVVTRISPDYGRKAALTLDIAWGNETIDGILDILKRFQVQATFFTSGIWLARYPGDCRKIQEAGHELGNHSYSHPHMTELPADKALEEISSAQRLLRDITGTDCHLFRFPYGESDQELTALVYEKGLIPVGWSASSRDWEDIAPEEICADVQGRLEPGGIILLHGSGNHAVEVLERLIPALLDQGYALMPATELLREVPAYRDFLDQAAASGRSREKELVHSGRA